MSGKPVTIGDIEFPNISSAKERCRETLYRGRRGTEIVGADAEFVLAILQARPDKLEEIGSRKIVRFLHGMHRRNTRCFLVELDDGERLDFSCMKAVDNLVKA